MPSRRIGILSLALLTASAGLSVYGASRQAAPADAVAAEAKLDAPIADRPPPGVVLTISDPTTRKVLEHTGWIRELPFQVRWAEITTGPAVTEAFHAKVLDVGVAANMPPIHATWVGIPVKMIGVRLRQDPEHHPSWVIAVSPRSGVRSLKDLRGKRIAYSPGQVQGEVVLRTLAAAGLTAKDVQLVELPSPSADVYINAMAGGALDAAPLAAGPAARRYVARFGKDGARVLVHPPFHDDLTTVYVRQETLADPAKAAALKAYIRLWGRAGEWINQHPDEWARIYFQQDQGLSPEEARMAVEAIGAYDTPGDWRPVIARQQATVDLMAAANRRPRFDAAILFDRRFEHVGADAAAQLAQSRVPASRQLAQR